MSNTKLKPLIRTALPVALYLLFGVLIAAPIIYVLVHLVSGGNNEIWQHLKSTLLTDYILNSIILTSVVGLASCIIGVSCAWAISQYRFVFRNTLQWALLLPMALPAYISAFTYTGLLDIAGPVQEFLRDVTGWSYQDYFFPNIRSLSGACIVLTFVLYPYVYLLARASFSQQSQHLIEAGRSLGLSHTQAFFKIALPMARPAIIAGTALVMMETLADYGTVEYFGINTLTTGIFRTWFGMDEPQAAIQIASLLLVFALIALFLEKHSRNRSQFYQSLNRQSSLHTITGKKSGLVALVCSLPLLLGFIIPVAQLSVWAFDNISNIDNAFLTLCWNSFGLALVTAGIALIFAVLLHLVHRFTLLNQNMQNKKIFVKMQKFILTLCGMGYAIPGIVIAVGVVTISGAFDNIVGDALGLDELILSGSFFVLIYVYLVRFFAASSGAVEQGLSKVHPSLDEAARSLGQSKFQLIRSIHFPLLRGSLLTALLVVFVDTLKELPATLILRPFNFNTLAVRAYELASDDRLTDAALPALAIVITGLLPVILLSRTIQRTAQKTSKNSQRDTQAANQLEQQLEATYE